LVERGHFAALAGEFADLFPQSVRVLVDAADQVRQGVFDLLGSGPTSVQATTPRPGDTPPLDWCVDFKTRYRWSARAFSRDLSPSLGRGHDIKVPWELSRCQHLPWLAQAHALTGRAVYLKAMGDQIQDWIAANPPRLGPNWVCTMDVAIRIANWLLAIAWGQPDGPLSGSDAVEIVRSIIAHGRHIRTNLEWSDQLTSNHYLSDLVGLAYLGLLLPDLPEARQWREFALPELCREMEKQVYPDGVDFESSISYHRLVTELFLYPLILCGFAGVVLPDSYHRSVHRMLQFVAAYTKPDGTVPAIGDADNGRLHRLKPWGWPPLLADSDGSAALGGAAGWLAHSMGPYRESVDHRYLLAIGSVVFGDAELAAAAEDQWEEAFWLLGACPRADWRSEVRSRAATWRQARTVTHSRGFGNGQVYVMRSEDRYLVLDAGPNGQKGNGGHAHNDTLSFEVFAYGRTWLWDSGTYVYTPDSRARDRFRSSTWHNTLTVDNEEINRIPDSLFRLQEDARPTINRWESNAVYDLVDAEHDGYIRLSQPVRHRRQILFDKAGRYWLLRDSLHGNGRNNFTWHFNCGERPPVGEPGISSPRFTLSDDDYHFTVMVLSLPGSARWASTDLEISYSYGTRRPGFGAEWSLQATAPAEATFALVPWRSEENLAGRLAGCRRWLVRLQNGTLRGPDPRADGRGTHGRSPTGC